MWLTLIATLPTNDPTTCMKVLRSLDSLGAGLLRDGVYLLPDSPVNRMGMQRLEMLVRATSGIAYIVRFESRDAAQEQTFRALFDRSVRYGELRQTLSSLAMGFGVSDPAAIAKVVKRLARMYDSIATIDFFPGSAKEDVGTLLAETENRVNSLLFPNDPSVAPRPRDRSAFLRKTWATPHPMIPDRLASAWLVRRFIDPEAKIRFLETNETPPTSAVTFGFDGAQFTTSKEHLTYEELVRFFRLSNDVALARIANVVRAIEVGDRDAPEASSVEVMLTGARNRAQDHQSLFGETEKLFDLLYDQYFAPSLANEEPATVLS